MNCGNENEEMIVAVNAIYASCVKKPEKNWINMIVIDVIDFMFFLLTDSFFILIRNYNEIENNSVSLISESN